MELFDKLDHQKNGRLKLEIFIAGVQSQQLCAPNVTSTPPPPTVGWGPKPIHMVNCRLFCSLTSPLMIVVFSN